MSGRGVSSAPGHLGMRAAMVYRQAMTTKLTDAELSTIANGNKKIVSYLREQQNQVAGNTVTTAQNVADTDTINKATVITLSQNDAFDFERVLAVGDGLTITDQGPGEQVVLDTTYPIATVGGFTLSLALSADTSLVLPSTGALITNDFSGLVAAANDAAAATAGVPIGHLYQASGAVRVRLT